MASRREQRVSRRPRGARLGALALLEDLACAGCVTENMATGEMVPRGDQRYEFSKVEKYAERLQDGMTRNEVLLLLGAPAERDDENEVWVYLPERYGIIVPARALRLDFKDGVLVEHGYRPIVLGATL